MTQIINGTYETNELSSGSNGGTEQMAKRMVRDIDPELLKGYQIIHSRVRGLEPDLKKIFVAHDLHNDPEVSFLTDTKERDKYEKFVFVSNWQMQMYNLSLGVPYSKSIVIPNGIESIPYVDKDYTGTIRIIYHTTPHRGLNILYAVFCKLVEAGYNIHLDVFSSFKVYGDAWATRDDPYKPLFEKLDAHPNITNHGSQPNSVVREALQKSHIFAYPSIWPETSCISAIEALSSGNFVVHPNYAALPETMANNGFMYQWDEDLNRHANTFALNLESLIRNITNEVESAQKISYMIASSSNNVYDWKEKILPKWNKLLTSLKN